MKNDVKGKAATDTVKKTATAAKKTAVSKEKAAESVVAAVKTAEQAAAKAVEKAVEKTEDVAAKAEKAVKTAAKKAPAKKTAVVKETIYLQYLGKEIDKDELVQRVKDIWTKDLEQKAADLKDVTLYLKPEENAAYYVVNGDVTGKIEL